MYGFSTYCTSTERMMRTWYEHSASVLEHSGDLGAVREYFIQEVLGSFLPKTVVVGTGEIIDGTEDGRSGQQDVILYRADFPIIASHTSINTFLIEGVIATIEVKSDLSKGSLRGAFKSAARVKRLVREAKILKGTENEIAELQTIHNVRTFVVGYSGWQQTDALVRSYRAARKHTRGIVPDAVYYAGDPGACVVHDAGLGKSGIVREQPFSYLFQILLKAVLNTVNPVVEHPTSEAKMMYTFNHYFSLPRVKLENVDDSKFE